MWLLVMRPLAICIGNRHGFPPVAMFNPAQVAR
jgi:hypothetical protein